MTYCIDTTTVDNIRVDQLNSSSLACRSHSLLLVHHIGDRLHLATHAIAIGQLLVGAIVDRLPLA